MPAVDSLVRPDRYPRSSAHSQRWLLSLDMGPHPLWQLEDLLEGVTLPAGSRVLDLGPGMGATTVFLVREFGSVVTSFDEWVDIEQRSAVIRAAGIQNGVEMLTGDVRTTELAAEAFDAIVSVDAFEYFGTDVRLLPRLLGALRPGGLLAMSTPALRPDPYESGMLPPHVAEVVGWEAAGWHSPEWWATHWQLSGLVCDVDARWQRGGRDDWLLWETARQEQAGETDPSPIARMLQADSDEQIGFALVTARKL